MADEGGGDTITLDVVTTLADHVAFLVYVTRRPRRLAIHAALFIVLGLLFTLFEVVLGVLTAMFLARHGIVDAVQHYFTSGIRKDMSDSWPVTWGVVAAIFLANIFVFTPMQCRKIATRLLATYPECANDQPTRPLTSRLHFDARGVETATRNERVFMAWPLIARLAETSRYLYVMRSASAGLMLPKRAVDAAQLERVRAFCARHIGRPGAPAS